MDEEILTIRELAALSKIGEMTAYTMARSNKLPGFKLRDQWRFRRCDLDAWVDKPVRQSEDADDVNNREDEP